MLLKNFVLYGQESASNPLLHIHAITMTETYIALFGGLAGSILTVIATKLFELKQKSLEHNQLLKKEFFIKKINAMESATGQWALLLSAMGNLASLFKLLTEEDVDFDDQTEETLLANINAQLARASDASYQLANSVFLYFDLDSDKFWDFDTAEQILRLYGEIGNLQSQMEILEEHYEKHQETELGDIIDENMEKIEEAVGKKALEIANLFDGIKSDYKGFLKAMRNEMKKFEN